MKPIERITRNPSVMGGKPCIRGMRITAGVIVGLVNTGHSHREILDLYPELEEADILAALADADWQSSESEVELQSVKR